MKSKYEVIKMIDMFNVKSNQEVFDTLKQGCKEALNISNEDFDKNFFKIKNKKTKKDKALIIIIDHLVVKETAEENSQRHMQIS